MAEALAQLTSLDPLRATLSSRQKAETAAGEKLAESAKAKGELQGLQQEMESKRRAEKSRQVARLEQDYAKSVAEAPQREEMKAVTQEMAKPFIPSKENAQDMAALFSLINVVGFALGRGGKGNAQAAMSAMNGMLEGHRAGREDVYKKELKEFDLNLKQLKTRFDTLDRDLKDALEIYKTDKAAGMAAAEEAYNNSEADFYKQYADKYGLAAMYELHKQNMTAAQRAVDKADKELVDAERKNLQIQHQREREAAAERHHRERLAQQERLAKAKEEAKNLKQVTSRSATNERYANTVYRSSNEVLRSMELIEQIGLTTGGGALGGVVGKGSIPSEVQRQIGQYFTEEQQRNYNTAMSGVALEIAYVLNGGYKPDVGTINKIETLLSVGPNDTVGNAAYKFSDLAAKLHAAIEVSPTYTEEQKNTREKLLKKLDRYATPEEVYKRVYGVGERREPIVRAGEYPKPQTQAEFDALPPGAEYIDPDDGKLYKKPKAK